jgi:hypothetical protein
MNDSGATSSSSNHVVNHDYNNTTSDKNSYLARPSSFSGDDEQFSWCKSKMYSHIIGVDDELWDIIEDGICFPINHDG